MYQKKTWSHQEDSIIKKGVNQMGDRPKWKQIAEQVNHLMGNRNPSNRRTSKQCRQRWHNKLNPHILDKQWDQDQINKLFKLHNEYGNKWSLIATMMNGRTDNCVKNKFYSALRKGMRKINKYIVNLKRKLTQNKNICIKEFKDVVLTKLIAVADKKYDDKLDVKQNSRSKTEKLSQAIKLALVQVSNNEDDYFGHVKNGVADDTYDIEEMLYKNIQEFCRNCKRKKGKRKSDDQEEAASQMIEESEQIEQESVKASHNAKVQSKNEQDPNSFFYQPAVKVKGKTSNETIIQEEKIHGYHINSTYEDLNERQVQLAKGSLDIAYTSFTKVDVQKPKEEPKSVKKETKRSKTSVFEEVNNSKQQTPQFAFFQNIRSIEYQRTDHNNKETKDFKPHEIFKQAAMPPTTQPLDSSHNQFSLSSSNQFGMIEKSQSLLNLCRSFQSPNMELNPVLYNSSSFSSSSNKEKLMELLQSIEKGDKKDDVQSSQVFAQSFNFTESLQLDDLFRRMSEHRN